LETEKTISNLGVGQKDREWGIWGVYVVSRDQRNKRRWSKIDVKIKPIKLYLGEEWLVPL